MGGGGGAPTTEHTTIGMLRFALLIVVVLDYDGQSEIFKFSVRKMKP